MTDFVDIVATSGTPKATKVRQLKNREQYSPAKDFYKRVRDAIVDVHEKGLKKSALTLGALNLHDEKKVEAYTSIVAGYKKWWGTKDIEWFKPVANVYEHSNVQISVNPELGLRINDSPHIVKLYFKSDKLSKAKADLILGLMKLSLQSKIAQAKTMALMDTRRSKLFVPTIDIPSLQAMINAEISYISSLWESV